LPERESLVLNAALSGRIPEFLRNFVDVRSTFVDKEGEVHEAVFRVMPDYLSIGTDEDFVRMPLTPHVAQHIADIWGCVLPTRKMVDLIYQHADVKLKPQPMTQDRESFATFLEHDRLIQQQWDNRLPNQLVAGIKKDVVITNRLAEKPGRVAIYGWHQPNGEPIQPLTTVHVEGYVDYSHGIRFVDQWALVDNERQRITDILQDSELCHLLSDEGPISIPMYRANFPTPD